MSYAKILDVDGDFLKAATSQDFMDELSQDIERKLSGLDDMAGLPYNKRDIVRLISSIETGKFRFLKGEIRAKHLYCDVDRNLNLFTIKHPGFDYLKDPAMNVYFS
jgi:hypothetical protein